MNRKEIDLQKKIQKKSKGEVSKPSALRAEHNIWALTPNEGIHMTQSINSYFLRTHILIRLIPGIHMSLYYESCTMLGT